MDKDLDRQTYSVDNVHAGACTSGVVVAVAGTTTSTARDTSKTPGRGALAHESTSLDRSASLNWSVGLFDISRMFEIWGELPKMPIATAMLKGVCVNTHLDNHIGLDTLEGSHLRESVDDGIITIKGESLETSNGVLALGLDASLIGDLAEDFGEVCVVLEFDDPGVSDALNTGFLPPVDGRESENERQSQKEADCGPHVGDDRLIVEEGSCLVVMEDCVGGLVMAGEGESDGVLICHSQEDARVLVCGAISRRLACPRRSRHSPSHAFPSMIGMLARNVIPETSWELQWNEPPACCGNVLLACM